MGTDLMKIGKAMIFQSCAKKDEHQSKEIYGKWRLNCNKKKKNSMKSRKELINHKRESYKWQQIWDKLATETHEKMDEAGDVSNH